MGSRHRIDPAPRFVNDAQSLGGIRQVARVRPVHAVGRSTLEFSEMGKHYRGDLALPRAPRLRTELKTSQSLSTRLPGNARNRHTRKNTLLWNAEYAIHIGDERQGRRMQNATAKAQRNRLPSAALRNLDLRIEVLRFKSPCPDFS